MNVHEYQAKELMREFDISVLNGGIAKTADEAVEVAKKLGGSVWVVKAQIHAGGRGKGGGVKVAKSLDEVKQYAGEIIGMTLVTPQTGAEGKLVNQVLIEEGCDIDHEYYAGIVLDRGTGRITMMTSREGGMEIEEVAHKTPEKIIKATIDPAVGFNSYVGRKLAFGIGLEGDAMKKCIKFLDGLYKMYIEKDCSIAEINPLSYN
jgi:succinyl-CoA synthetase beta subunit